MKWLASIIMFAVVAGCTTKTEVQQTGGHQTESVGPQMGHDTHGADHVLVIQTESGEAQAGAGSNRHESGDNRDKAEKSDQKPKVAEKKTEKGTPDPKKADEKTTGDKKPDEKKAAEKTTAERKSE
jgi:hypothetical protein